MSPGASESGAMFVAHSDDGHLGDARLMRVPAADHAPGGAPGQPGGARADPHA